MDSNAQYCNPIKKTTILILKFKMSNFNKTNLPVFFVVDLPDHLKASF